MSDLSTEGVHTYWKGYEDPSIYRVLSFMESVEQWTLDGDPAIENALTELSQELEDLSQVNFDNLGQQELFIRIANNIKSPRALRLLQIIDKAHPGTASRLLMHAEEKTQRTDDDPGLFLRRNIVFERLRLLFRIFSPARFNLVLKALEGDDHA